MANNMVHLAYVSQATHPFSEKELFELIDRSQMNNKKANITGILVYNSGHFLQLLEGDEKLVSQLGETIAKDPRHKDMTIFFQASTPEIIFRDWYMAYKNLSEYNAGLRGKISNLIDKAAQNPKLTSKDEFLQILRFMRQEL
ncbi:MAG: BLUF domain-containing protein [Oligoflexus sp.]